ncbi:hypothetical protein M9H77_26842 [Catharanthus roseus]|uniref:Uncharacterized protein n=1 Tax=Catharanthus roseus TaxID=4058 RepID=A0ACC0ACZ0_CATRO|nr:hypothetical protein M9H77_26842 [Catharanthus roseus]
MTAKCYHHIDSNYCAWYKQIKKKATHGHWKITRFTKKHICLVHVHQNKHQNMTSKFISKLISHLVANDPEIPLLKVIQEVQVKLQMGCTYKRAWYARKFTIERVFGSWEITFSILPKYLHAICGKWQEYTLPCSHANAVCRDNGTRPNAYVSDIYSRETYQSNFYLVRYEDFWRDAPYDLTFYPPNMNNQRGRKKGTRFRAKMNYRNPDSPPRCSRCRMPGQSRKNCNNPSSSNV